MLFFARISLFVLVAFLSFVGDSRAALTEDRPFASLRALDKITARVEELTIKVGEPFSFGTLVMAVRACRTAPPEDTPDSAAFIQIVDQRKDQDPVLIFSGWMFASSPALSAIEHPIYDLWVVGCKKEPTS